MGFVRFKLDGRDSGFIEMALKLIHEMLHDDDTIAKTCDIRKTLTPITLSAYLKMSKRRMVAIPEQLT